MWLVTYEDIEGRKCTRYFDDFDEAAQFLDQVGGWLHRDTEGDRG